MMKNIIIFIIVAAGCCYTHLLFAIIFEFRFPFLFLFFYEKERVI